MPQCSPIQNLPGKLQSLLLHFLNTPFLCHPLPQTALQFIHTLGLTPPFPNTLIYQWSHHARITKPAERSVKQINKQRLRSHNIDTQSLKTRFNKGKDARTTVSWAPIRPLLGMGTQRFRRCLGCPCWEGRFATAPRRRGSQAPSHTLIQHLPCLSSQPISHLPLPAQAKLHPGKLRAHCLLLLRSPQTPTWPFAAITAPHSLGGSPAFAPV